jgi:hypothetical protein
VEADPVVKVNAETGFAIYVTTLLLALVVLAAVAVWRERIREWQPSAEQLCRCPDCRYAFLIRRRESSAACPRCQRLCTTRDRG